ncbi:MAG: hypothetical protein AAFO82_21995, partial [Bacteroidota bacterium]
TTTPSKVLSESWRVLKRGGTITGSVAFLEPWTWRGKAQLTPSGIFELLSEQFFNVEYIWASWNVFDALEAAFNRKNKEKNKRIIDALKKANEAFSDLVIDNSQLLWEFAGALNFHAVKSKKSEINLIKL